MNKHSCIILHGIKLLYTELNGISLHYAASHCIRLLYTTLNYFRPFNFAYHFSLIPTITMYSSLTQSLAGIRQSITVQNCITQYNAVRCRVKQCIMQFHAFKSSVIPAEVQSKVTKSIAVQHSEKRCNSCKFRAIQSNSGWCNPI